MSTKRNIFKNGISSLGFKGVRVLEQLFLIPFFITHWGTDYYGEWLTLTIFPSILAYTDMGLGSAAANSFVLKYVEGDEQTAANILKTAFRVITFVIAGALLVGGLVLMLAFYFGLLKNSLIPINDSIYALLFMMGAKLLSFYMQLYESNYRAARKASLGINLQTLSGIMNVAGGLVVLSMGYGVVAFASVQFIIAIFDNLLFGRIGLSLTGITKRKKGIYSRVIAKEFFNKGFGYLMNPLWQTILFQGSTFVVRLVLGPTAVTMFNTVRTLSRSVNQMYSVINASIFPELQFEIGIGNFLKAKNILIKAMKITGGLAITGFLALAVVGLPIYNWWTKNELDPPYMMWLIFVLATSINAVWWTTESVFRATNQPYIMSVPGVIFAILALVVTYLGCINFSITGAAVGALVFEIGMAIYVMPKSLKLFEK